MLRVGRASCPPHFFARRPSSVLILALAPQLWPTFLYGSSAHPRRPLSGNVLFDGIPSVSRRSESSRQVRFHSEAGQRIGGEVYPFEPADADGNWP